MKFVLVLQITFSFISHKAQTLAYISKNARDCRYFLITISEYRCDGVVESPLWTNVLYYRVKSGNFGHQVNSDMRLQTVKIQMRRLPYEPSHHDFHCLLRNLFYIPITKI